MSIGNSNWRAAALDDTHFAAQLRSATHFAFLLVPNFSMIAFVNALEVLRMANQVSGGDIFEWSVSGIEGLPVRASNGLTVPAFSADRMDRADVVFVCGGNDIERTTTAAHLNLVRQYARSGKFIGGICTGAYVLAKAGLLKGYTCAIHWEYLYAQAERFFEVGFEERVFRIDRDRLTCAGGIAPVDMMLDIVRRSLGSEIVAMISSQFSLNNIRSTDARQKTTRYGSSRSLVSAITELMECNIETPLSLDTLSVRSGLSERQLSRTFRNAVGQPVMKYYRSLRLHHARQLLSQSSFSLTEVCIACGFQSHAHFATAYRKEFGLTPGQERERGDRGLAGGESGYNSDGGSAVASLVVP
ncbi:GlxA family transcriptional regulator [Paraburkholderia phenoliruptrix]|uniref:GlxA family transcriptional regulator n=2 Tax=Paraburkholderia phenoliruptrix TaxID=252970 RepID=A0A6J5K7E2_9BURK|nr:GlxA family transcriptional regulator [Paraburkholderia phenoliruptrix]AFT84742.1 transcriptional regulator [Paraburkholderia phenoliruptrix BR3459a]MDR6388317.1 transcriptional regulator GlxA family with amidase domain [Paraburkholderia phenoliruptrix]CAB4049577.1 HTH-type transcriptional regulator CdhR [Paraburkholderia phenoliruptrix]